MLAALSVSDNTKITYTDTGPPPHPQGYVTVLGIPGMFHTAYIFSRISNDLHAKGIRFVGINRRCFAESTSYSEEDLKTIAQGTIEEKTASGAALFEEIALFVVTFIQQNNIPSISTNGRNGGVAIFGWSFGGVFPLGIVAYSKKFHAETQSYLRSHLRALILCDPSTHTIGKLSATAFTSTMMDPAMNLEQRNRAVVEYLSLYFDHGDAPSIRDHTSLAISPCDGSPSSLSNMNRGQKERILTVTGTAAEAEGPLISALHAQLHDNYMNACFDADTRSGLPRMTAHVISAGGPWKGIHSLSRTQ